MVYYDTFFHKTPHPLLSVQVSCQTRVILFIFWVHEVQFCVAPPTVNTAPTVNWAPPTVNAVPPTVYAAPSTVNATPLSVN